MDFRQYGIPAREWQRFVAAHPEAGATASLPDDKSGAELQEDANSERRDKSQRNFEAEGLESAVHVEEAEIRAAQKGGDGDEEAQQQDRLTARVYTRVQRDDDLRLDKVPGVVYYHGGVYVFGTPDTERHLCGLVASRLRVVVVHVCYREAPQHRHPAQHLDGKDGFEWVVSNAERLGIDPEQIVIVGLSCGAGIAASTTLRVCNEDAEKSEEEARRRPDKRSKTGDDRGDGQGQDDPELTSSDDVKPEDKVYDRSAPFVGRTASKRRIKGLVLCVPWLLQEACFPYHLFRSREATSRVQCAEASGMSRAVYDRLCDMLGAEDQADPLLNVPLAPDAELARFPRTAFMIAGMDFFRDDGLILAERLKSLRVPRRVHMFKGMPHGFRKFDDLWSSQRFDELLLLLMNWALGRTISSIDVGFHVEQQEMHEREAKSLVSRVQSPPYDTRHTGADRTT
ncbi:hypothetical protein CONLIGDRAFT_91432 [Coniochaeta ligniaria NRRL 30616]|uniref:Alpha/beta hydrolase fold-3 domain-containing protein n=1 Tax=Coniochaeta ligniaria NRRL 30616 TaxID=1408157 RepID=A0A1J7IW93_9PEZI|nr:hypothetical protein CONLIGDRAFT_91432 [Coniochaeta ligniaria NRRL 30616]